MSYENEITYLSLNEAEKENRNQRKKLTQAQIDEILRINRNIPIDYLDYLVEIGSGSIMSSQFNVYENLTDFADLGLDDSYTLPTGVKLFGDNFSGDFSGFDLLKENPDEVIEFWHDSNKLFYTGKSFREYIREKILMPTST